MVIKQQIKWCCPPISLNTQENHEENLFRINLEDLFYKSMTFLFLEKQFPCHRCSVIQLSPTAVKILSQQRCGIILNLCHKTQRYWLNPDISSETSENSRSSQSINGAAGGRVGLPPSASLRLSLSLSASSDGGQAAVPGRGGVTTPCLLCFGKRGSGSRR